MKITINDYFDLDKIINSGQTFRASKTSDNTYRFISTDKILYISKTDCDNTSATYEVSCDESTWKSFWYDYFDLDRSYKDISASDKYADKCMKYGKGIRILKQDPFEMLISFIISQRKSIPAIKSSIEALCLKYGTCVDNNYNRIYLFPSPDQLSYATYDDFKECKLGYRISYIQNAISTLNNDPKYLSVGYNMNDEQLITHLMTIKGVGIKVANCIALFAYNRLSLAPQDTWINKIINTYYDGISPFDKYKENAGIIQQYMFYYAYTHKDEF